jgi:NTP pyrophosphatase (non-canonical NTP hydrolase)
VISSAVALICPPVRRAILVEVSGERDRQDTKWGGVPGTNRRDDHTYAAVLGEEVGEVCRAWLERDVASLRAELVQTAAVAIAWIEELDNGGAVPRA